MNSNVKRYDSVIDFIDEETVILQKNISRLAKSILARAESGDYYVKDIAHKILDNESAISYFNMVRSILLDDEQRTIGQIAQRMIAAYTLDDGIYRLGAEMYAETLMDMIANSNG